VVRVKPEYFEDGYYGGTIARMVASPGLATALVLE
jgi:hypothetical protein